MNLGRANAKVAPIIAEDALTRSMLPRRVGRGLRRGLAPKSAPDLPDQGIAPVARIGTFLAVLAHQVDLTVVVVLEARAMADAEKRHLRQFL